MMKFCKKCGNERKGIEKFCSECGTPFDNVSTKERKTVKEETASISPKYIPYILGAIVLIVVCGGGWYGYDRHSTYEAEKQAREKFGLDSLEKAKKDSIRAVEEKKKKEIEEKIALEKRQKLIPMKIVLDLYKREDFGFTKQTLKEYGYELFKTHNGQEIWTKDVTFKKVELYNGVVYKAAQKKGSSALLSEDTSYYGFSISVHTQQDFDEWVRQLEELGYKYKSYEHPLEENGWTPLGAHGNLCRKYEDSKGNVIEFMKIEDEELSFDVYIVEFK